MQVHGDAIHRVSNTVTIANESAMQVYCRDAIHRVSKAATIANESAMQVYCRDAINRVSNTVTIANESAMQVHGDAMNRVSTMGSDGCRMALREKNYNGKKYRQK